LDKINDIQDAVNDRIGVEDTLSNEEAEEKLILNSPAV